MLALVVGVPPVFRNVQPEVMDVFEITGFDKILTFEQAFNSRVFSWDETAPGRV